MFRRKAKYHEIEGRLGWLERLKDEGFTHLLLVELSREGQPPRPTPLGKLLHAEESRATSGPGSATSGEALPWRELARWRHVEPNFERTYRLLEIQRSKEPPSERPTERVASGKP